MPTTAAAPTTTTSQHVDFFLSTHTTTTIANTTMAGTSVDVDVTLDPNADPVLIRRKGILFTRTWFSSSDVVIPPQQAHKTVKWQVDESAPERTGPWKCPKRSKKAAAAKRKKRTMIGKKSFRKGECYVSRASREWEKNYQNHEISLRNHWSDDAGSNHSSDYSPARPLRKESVEKHQNRRRSLLGSMFSGGSKEKLNATDSFQDNNNLTSERRRSSLLGSFSYTEGVTIKDHSGDLAPSKPSRRGSTAHQSRRRSLLGTMLIGGSQENVTKSPEDQMSKEIPRSSLRGSFSYTEGVTKDRSSDFAPSKPSRRSSLDLLGRRQSLLGAMFAGSKEQLVSEDSEDNKSGEKWQSSLRGSLSLADDKKEHSSSSDSAPSRPSRKGSIEHQSRRRSLLETMFSGSKEKLTTEGDQEKSSEIPRSSLRGSFSYTEGVTKDRSGDFAPSKPSRRGSMDNQGRRRSLLGAMFGGSKEALFVEGADDISGEKRQSSLRGVASYSDDKKDHPSTDLAPSQPARRESVEDQKRCQSALETMGSGSDKKLTTTAEEGVSTEISRSSLRGSVSYTEGVTKNHASDSAPSKPSRRGSAERRRSLFGAMFSGSKQKLTMEGEEGKPGEKLQSSLRGTLSYSSDNKDHPSSDFAPSKPSRRGSVEHECRRQSSVGDMPPGSNENLTSRGDVDVMSESQRSSARGGLSDSYSQQVSTPSCQGSYDATSKAAYSEGGVDTESCRTTEDSVVASPRKESFSNGRRRSFLGSFYNSKGEESPQQIIGRQGRRGSLLGSMYANRCDDSLDLSNIVMSPKEQGTGKPRRRRSILGRMFSTSSLDHADAPIQDSIDSTSAMSMSGDVSVTLAN